jgi:cytochrome P450
MMTTTTPTHLARLEVRVMFEELLARVDRVEQVGEVRRVRSNVVHSSKELPVRVPRR